MRHVLLVEQLPRLVCHTIVHVATNWDVQQFNFGPIQAWKQVGLEFETRRCFFWLFAAFFEGIPQLMVWIAKILFGSLYCAFVVSSDSCGLFALVF